MRTRANLILFVFLAAALADCAGAQTQTADQTQRQPGTSAAGPVTTVNEAIDRIIAREGDEITTIRRYNPIIETYIQDIKPDKDLGAVPDKDHYFLGQANLARGVVDNLVPSNNKGKLDESNPLSHVSGFSTSSHAPEDFLRMIFLDASGFDRQHYQFDYVGRQFLGEVRCLMFDVTPLPEPSKGRFRGRIWAEDEGYTIVRFTGAYTPLSGINGFNLHFDSWRLNLQPGLWLPSFVFSKESDPMGNHVRFEAETCFWAYNLGNTVIQDQAATQPDRSPVEAADEWQHEAEVNVINRLQRTGLLAPPGEVDKVLETVVNNIEVTNNLDIEPDVKCRVLLTDTFESFSIGHTIVISRGLLDVLPDEASLATILAQELADIIVTKPSTDRWGFDDTTNVTTVEAVGHFSFKDTPDQLHLASQKAVELLRNSPYKDKFGNAGLLLKQLDAQSKNLPALISPHLGNRVGAFEQLMSTAPQLQSDKLDQIAVLSIGARIKLDPWDDRVELLKAKPVAQSSAQEKVPFEVTPFLPFLTRFGAPPRIAVGGSAGGETKPTRETPGSEGGTPGQKPQQ